MSMDDWSAARGPAQGSELFTMEVNQNPLTKNPNKGVAQCNPTVESER